MCRRQNRNRRVGRDLGQGDQGRERILSGSDSADVVETCNRLQSLYLMLGVCVLM